MHFRERGLINVQHDYLEHVISILSRFYKYIGTYIFEIRQNENIQVQWSKDISRYIWTEH